MKIIEGIENDFKKAKQIALILIDGPHKGEFGIVKSFEDGKYHIHPMQTQVDHESVHYYTEDEIVVFNKDR